MYCFSRYTNYTFYRFNDKMWNLLNKNIKTKIQNSSLCLYNPWFSIFKSIWIFLFSLPVLWTQGETWTYGIKQNIFFFVAEFYKISCCILRDDILRILKKFEIKLTNPERNFREKKWFTKNWNFYSDNISVKERNFIQHSPGS